MLSCGVKWSSCWPLDLNDRYGISIFRTFVFFIFWTISSAFSSQYTVFDLTNPTQWSSGSKKLLRASTIFQSAYSMTSVLYFILKIRHLRRFNDYAILLSIDNKKLSISHYFLIDIVATLCALCVSFWKHNDLVGSLLLANFYSNTMLCTVISNYFGTAVQLVGNRAKSLNLVFRAQHFRDMNAQSDTHHSLCSMAAALNSSHDMPLTFLFLSAFVKILVCTKTVIVGLAGSPSPDPTLLVSIFLIVATSANVYGLVSRVVSTSNEINLFGALLLEAIMREPNQKKLINKLEIHLIMNRQIEFSASGFFVVDFSAVFSMLAMMGSFLAVLIQSEPTIRL